MAFLVRRVILVACVLLVGLSAVLPLEAVALVKASVESEETSPPGGGDSEESPAHAKIAPRLHRASAGAASTRFAVALRPGHAPPASQRSRPRPIPQRAAGPAAAALSLLN